MKYIVMISFVSHSVIEPRIAKTFDDVKSAKKAAYDFIEQDRGRVNERPDLSTTPVYQVSPHELTPSEYQNDIYRVDLLEWYHDQQSIVETAVVCPVS